MAKKWVADFETTTNPADCRVWCWGVCNIENPQEFYWGKTIEEFIEWCKNDSGNGLIWMHNLKFDAQFIIPYLLNNGYEWCTMKNLSADKFTTLITQRGEFYTVKIGFGTGRGGHNKKVEFYDSLKLLNLSVKKIAETFGFNIKKGEIEYDKTREVGYDPDDNELDYLKNDCQIVAMALGRMFDNGVKGITIGHSAMEDFRSRRSSFGYYFPKLSDLVEEDIRQAYKGGFTYLNPLYRETEIGRGFFLDKNSMYPAMMQKKLPIGRPVFFNGKYKEDKMFDLYIQKISVIATLKDGKVPFLRSRTHPEFHPLDYIESTKGEFLTVTLTNMELGMLFENYTVDDIIYHSGWKFKSSSHVFDEYIKHWTKQKEEAKKSRNIAKYQISKMYLNSLIGKFGSRLSGRQLYPKLGKDGVVNYKTYPEKNERRAVYSPIALFVTAYARCDLIDNIDKIRKYGWEKHNRDVYIYSDTDSIVTSLDITDLEELNKILDLDDSKLGSWKVEKIFKNGKFLHSKCYMVIDQTGISHATIAGMPKELAQKLNLEQFSTGFSTADMKKDKDMIRFKKKKQVLVKNGVVLRDTDYTL